MPPAEVRMAVSEGAAQALLDEAAACGWELVEITAPHSGERHPERWRLVLRPLADGVPRRHARLVACGTSAEARLAHELSAAGRDGYRLRCSLGAVDDRPFWSVMDTRSVMAHVLERVEGSTERWEYRVPHVRSLEPRSYQNWFPKLGVARSQRRLEALDEAGFTTVSTCPRILERRRP